MKGILISPFNSTNTLHNFLFTKQFINHIDTCIFLISNDNKNNKEIFQKFIQTLKINEQPNIKLHHFQIFPHSIHDTIEILHNQVHPIIQKLNPSSIFLNISCNNEIISNHSLRPIQVTIPPPSSIFRHTIQKLLRATSSRNHPIHIHPTN